MFSLLYIILALFALSFLIFIHELGHYWMARRVGMRVETFAIGFGRPIYSWVKDGVTWQIGWLPFGGYVRIAGTESSDDVDPYEIADGFFGKSPWDRIKVAFMGPFMNLIFALLVFTIIWMAGGREKNFSEFTHKIGWIDPNSELYAQGVRPGDEISAYNGQEFSGVKDHLYAPITASELEIQGSKVDYATGQRTPFTISTASYSHPNAIEKGIQTAGILNSASYLIYDRLPGGKENPLPEGSPMEKSGIEYGDRLVWVDGELIFSLPQLNHILNDKHVLLTIERKGTTFLRRTPLVQVQELKLDHDFREELIDWQFEAQLNNLKTGQLYTIPYNLSDDAVVEGDVRFIDRENQEKAFPKHLYSDLEAPLQAGDIILAVDGTPIRFSYQLLEHLQKHQVNIIVERNQGATAPVALDAAEKTFDDQADIDAVNQITKTIGTKQLVRTSGNYFLLNSVVPKMRTEFMLSPEKQAMLTADIQEKKTEIENIEDPEKKARALQVLESREKELLLGLPGIQDRKVAYNPGPFQLFGSVFDEIRRTLGALFSGSLNPKWIIGPIGIVQVVHDNWMQGFMEGLFWIGALSLNLGILNLLPIPVLDGGTIMLSLFELVTHRKIRPKTLEKLIIPFAVLLICFFLYLTYNDVTRIFKGIFG